MAQCDMQTRNLKKNLPTLHNHHYFVEHLTQKMTQACTRLQQLITIDSKK